MKDVQNHEARSRELADTLRRTLIGLNTGAVAASVLLASGAMEKEVEPSWAVPALLMFLVSLSFVLLSMHVAKDRELRRRDAARDGRPAPNFNRFFWRSYTWDMLATAAFILGVGLGLCGLSGMRRPGQPPPSPCSHP